MDSLRERTIQSLKFKKERAENGEINCIPFGFTEFQGKFPGLEQSTYLLITGATKAGKSQIANYLVLYNSILYAYHNPNELRVKVLYFPLEESSEIITLRFISYLLYMYYNIRISPTELRSTNRTKPLTNDILKLIESDEISKLLDFFDKCVDFYEDANTSVSISVAVNNYAKEHGELIYSKETFMDERTHEIKHYIDHYIPNDPDEYVFVLLDHANLLVPTREERDILTAITNMSKNMVKCKNMYKYIPVVIQQQVDSETSGLDAIKNNNILATKAGLKDCKATGQDCTLLWGISNPGSIQSKTDWENYDLVKFKKKYLRVFQIILNRFGEGDIVIPVYFDGAVNYYQLLPHYSNEEKLQTIYQLINKNETNG